MKGGRERERREGIVLNSWSEKGISYRGGGVLFEI